MSFGVGRMDWSPLQDLGRQLTYNAEVERQREYEREAAMLLGRQVDGLVGGSASPAPAPLPNLGAGGGSPASASQSLPAAPSFAATGGDLGDYLATTRAKESGGNDLARNPNSTAKGRYQFTTGTWNAVAKQHPELGLTPGGWRDPAQQEKAMQAFTMDNARQLSSAGIPINPTNLYGAHFLGSGGARKFIPGAINNPDAPAIGLVGPGVAEANRTVFFNRDGTPKTAGQVYAWMGSRYGGSAGQQQAPAPQRVQVAALGDMSGLGGVPGAQTALPSGPAVPQPMPAPPQMGQPQQVAQTGFEPGSVASPPIVGGGAAGPLPAPTGTPAPRLSPEQAQNLRAMLANPLTRAAAQAQIQKLRAPTEFDFKVVGDQLYRTSPTGAVEPVNVQKAPSYQSVKGEGGETFTFNPQTGEYRRALPGQDRSRRDLTVGEKQARGIEPNVFAQVDANGEVFFPGKPSSVVNLDQKREGTFAGKAGGAMAERLDALVKEGDSGRTDAALLGQIRSLGDDVGTGLSAQATKLLGDYGVAVGPTTGKVQAYSSLIDKLTPAQRIPGSGATSDFDARLFKASLPRLINQPEGNALIIGTLEALAKDKMERAAIAEQGLLGEQDGGLSVKDTMQRLRALPSPNFVLRSGLEELRKSGKLGPGAAAAPTATDGGSQTAKPLPANVRAEAQKALAAGRDPEGVRAKLRTLGFDPSGL